MENKNHLDEEQQKQFHSLTDNLDYILGALEPEETGKELWTLLLIINDEAPLPEGKNKKLIKQLYKRMVAMIDTVYQLQHLEKLTGIRVSDADEKQTLNPAYSLPGKKDMVYENTSMLHEGLVRSLSFEECLDPYKFIQSFFEYRSVIQWKNSLKSWKEKATRSSSIVDGCYIENSLETYRYLFKMVETCFVLFEMEYNGKLNIPFNYFFIRDNMPAYCSVEMILWPFEGLYYLYESVHLPELESDLQSWWEATIAEEYSWRGTALELIRLHETVQMMIEMGFMIKNSKYFQKDWLFPKKWNLQPDEEPPKIKATFPTPHLTYEEIQNPFLALHENCKLDIGWFREILRERLETALDPAIKLDIESKTLNNILKIIEALYVLNNIIFDPEKRGRLFAFTVA